MPGDPTDALRDVANALTPAGPVAARLADTWWILFVAATFVFVVVMALIVAALLRRGRPVQPTQALDEEGVGRGALRFLLAGTGVTVLILVGVSVLTFVTMNAVAEPEREPRYTFEVVGHQWWWEIRVNGRTVSANELHVPVGEPVRIELRSADVIHSFWVPELAGKLDLVPGNVNRMWLRADEAGTYRGPCAEFCGTQHAKMRLLVVAEPAERFETWLTRVQDDAAEPGTDAERRGQEVFFREGCAGCHAVRGSGAGGDAGPDLTHLASRLTLGAGTLPNTRGNLGGWIVDPHAFKPGNFMPPQDLSGGDLDALLTYLDSLR